jgi:hypothetical protein
MMGDRGRWGIEGEEGREEVGELLIPFTGSIVVTRYTLHTHTHTHFIYTTHMRDTHTHCTLLYTHCRILPCRKHRCRRWLPPPDHRSALRSSRGCPRPSVRGRQRRRRQRRRRWRRGRRGRWGRGRRRGWPKGSARVWGSRRRCGLGRRR